MRDCAAIRSIRSWPLAALIAAALPAGAAAASQPPSWLDQPVPDGWNAVGRAVPVAVRDPHAQGDARCADQYRSPSKSRADRAVVKAGWSLVGPLQVFGDTELVTAASGVDGMCRPLGFQAFVFRNGKFVGTLSPLPMASRTDGIANEIRLVAPDRLHAEYARYADQDPLCCPSATTSVRFEIRGTGKAAVVVPVDAQTQVTASPPAAGGAAALSGNVRGTTRIDPEITSGAEAEPALELHSAGRPGRASDRSLTNTYWKLVRLGDREVTVTEGRREPHLILRVADRKVAGSGGCNSLNGAYVQEGAALSFGTMASTKMMCAEAMEQERRFLEVLGQVRGWRIDGDGLELLDASGRAVARFVAVDLD